MTTAVALIGNVQSGVSTPRRKAIETFEPFRIPLAVPAGPDPIGCMSVHVPVSEEPVWVSVSVNTLSVKKPCPVHVPVSCGDEGAVADEEPPPHADAQSEAANNTGSNLVRYVENAFDTTESIVRNEHAGRHPLGI